MLWVLGALILGLAMMAAGLGEGEMYFIGFEMLLVAGVGLLVRLFDYWKWYRR